MPRLIFFARNVYSGWNPASGKSDFGGGRYRRIFLLAARPGEGRFT
jgi:hypothetical protein